MDFQSQFCVEIFFPQTDRQKDTAVYTFRPVSLNLSHISHASHAEPEVLSVEGSSYGAGNGGLSYTRRTVETQDLPLGGAPQVAHCYEFLHKDREEVRFMSTGKSSTRYYR